VTLVTEALNSVLAARERRKPDALPLQLPSKYQLVVNLKAAKVIGLSIPPAFLCADEVIE
jgi:hypothetical protein